MRASRSVVVALALVAAAAPSGAVEKSFDLYLQEAFPKQTRTNAQIAEINAAFGTDFDDWDDVHNLSLGAKLLWRVAPRWPLSPAGAFGLRWRGLREPEPCRQTTDRHR